jgi:chemotaxis protein MotB
MALRRRGGKGEELNPWPGYVDALSTLLMVIIFVLLVFVLAQAFLSVALTGRDQALDRVNRQMAELSDMLALERGRAAELRLSIAQLNRDLTAATATRDSQAQQLVALRLEQERLSADRDTLKSDRDRLSAQLADVGLQIQSAQSRTDQLQAALAESARRADAAGQTAAAQLADTKNQLAESQRNAADLTKALTASRATIDARVADLKSLTAERDAMLAQIAELDRTVKADRATIEARLSDLARAAADLKALTAQRDAMQAQIAELDRTVKADRATIEGRLSDLARAADMLRALTAQRDAMQAQIAELDRTVKADRTTIEARLSDLSKMSEQVRALTALRDQLERQAREAAAKSLTDEQVRAGLAAQLSDEKKLSDTARAQVALLTRQIDELRAQLSTVARALDASEKSAQDKDAQITNLGSRLNAALAQKVEELQRYRSDFFGRLREVLANRSGVQVVGDRFVFQSEVLFPSGSADLTTNGWEQIKTLATTLLEISRDIPPDVRWVLRVDGHADRQPVQNARFPSNWELSANRAITVVKLLVASGVPADRLAATAFGENQPLDQADTPDAYARNRRIELRLTDR